jgi:F-type H+-transporting ATPase subunit epsilon
MADTMQFDLVSPERRLASMQVQAVLVPGADGDLTAMADHAPLIATLRPGMLRVESGAGHQEYLVTGGFAEIGDGLSVLAEQALLRADVTQDIFDTLAADAKAAHDAAKSSGGDIDATFKRVADIEAVGTELGMTTR